MQGTILSVLLLSFLCERCASNSTSSLPQVTTTSQACPQFMESLYRSVLKGKRRLSNVIHSNTAVDVKSANGSFEAIFNDLSFSHFETLKRVKLRVNVSRQKQCSSKYTLRVLDGEKLQVIDQYFRVMKHHGINSIPLTKSLKKWMLADTSVNKSLQVKITFDSLLPGANRCHQAVSDVSKDAYLVMHTKAKVKPRKYRLKRSSKKTSPPLSTSKTCVMKKVDVYLQGGSIIAPTTFRTGVCAGASHTLSTGASAIRKEVHTAINKAIKRNNIFISNNSCCVPTQFKKLVMLYTNSKNSNLHYVLQSVDKIVVTKCGCPSKT